MESPGSCYDSIEEIFSLSPFPSQTNGERRLSKTEIELIDDEILMLQESIYRMRKIYHGGLQVLRIAFEATVLLENIVQRFRQAEDDANEEWTTKVTLRNRDNA